MARRLMFYHYPGDPIDECIEMTRAEFLKMQPNRVATFSAFPGGVVAIPLGDDVLCDLCAKEIAEPDALVYLLRNCSYLKCRKCWEETVEPYLLWENKP
jgi:hypothetical protein